MKLTTRRYFVGLLATCCSAALGTLGVSAAPLIEKVEPPNWWLGHSWNPVQVLLTGRELEGAQVASVPRGLRAEVRHVSEDGRYLFLYVTIGKGTRPGKQIVRLKTRTGTAEFVFVLDPPASMQSQPQGFGPDDVIYLIMPDRFANGDPENDSPPEFSRPANRADPRAYHGGDIRGIIQRLGYLKDLGVTGIWLTPIYQNSNASSSPYHGYHAVDFYAVEPRFGTLEDMRELVQKAHALGLKVIQDQVANHCGPEHPWVKHPPTPSWFNYFEVVPKPRNNFDIPSLADPYARPKRRDLPLRGWFNGRLPDLNQDDPLVADYLIQNTLWWIGMTGIDGIRQDTYPYVDRRFWEKWQNAIRRQFPTLTVTGEITAPSPAVLSFFEGGTRRAGIDTGLPSMLDFPLAQALRRVFASGEAMSGLAAILAQDSLYRRPQNLVVFPGNHDQPRFLTLAKGDPWKLIQATAFALTTRRTVHLYYGDEIGMEGGNDPDNRRDFPGGWPSDTENAFLPEGRRGIASLIFEWTRDLLHFRQRHVALRKGELVNLIVEPDRYVYLRTYPGEHVLVALARGGKHTPLTVELDDLQISDGITFRHFRQPGRQVVVAGGKVHLNQDEPVQIYWASSKSF